MIGTTALATRRGKGRIAGERGHREPDQAEDERRRPSEPEEHADIGCDALAAAEVSQTGNRWPRKAPRAAQHGSIAVRQKYEREQDRDGALEHVAEKVAAASPLFARAQHVGRADIAGADAADVLRAGEPRSKMPNGIEPQR